MSVELWIGLFIGLVGAGLVIKVVRQRDKIVALDNEVDTLQAQLETQQAIGQRELAWHRDVFDYIPVAVVITDLQKRLITMNSTAEMWFGDYSPGARAILSLRHHTFDTVIDDALQHGNSDETQVRFSDRVLQAQARIWYHASEPAGVVLTLLDITEVVYLARARRDLAANLGHELRTPLTSMRIILETLRDTGVEDQKLFEHMLGRLDRENDAMIRLVEDLTTISVIENGRVPLRLQRHSLAEVVNNTVVRMQPIIEKNTIRIHQEFEPALIVSLDKERFAQVLTNVLNNAVKFTPAGGEIMIRGYRVDDTVRLDVQDSGPGIPASVLPRIFERFYKYDQARTRSEKAGTGIGLAVVKHLVKAHGGRVWAESPPGKGAKITLELPAEPVNGEGTHEPQPAVVEK